MTGELSGLARIPDLTVMKNYKNLCLEKLHMQLMYYLATTRDPRFTDAPLLFDQYPYRTPYMAERFKEKGYRYSEQTDWISVKFDN